MPSINVDSVAGVKPQIVEYLRRVPFERAIEELDFNALIEADAASIKPLFPQDSIDAFHEARDLRHTKRAHPTPAAFISNKSVLIVPGFMGSQLKDYGNAGNGLIWIDPKIYITPSQLSALQLALTNRTRRALMPIRMFRFAKTRRSDPLCGPEILSRNRPLRSADGSIRLAEGYRRVGGGARQHNRIFRDRASPSAVLLDRAFTGESGRARSAPAARQGSGPAS